MDQAQRVPLAPMAAMRWAIVRDVLRRVNPRSTIEMGCGQGGFGARIAASGGSYLGVEPDLESSAVARARVEPAGGQVITGTVDDVPETQAFDLLCAFEVLEHLEDDLGLLRSWLTRLRPGGYVVVSVPAWPDRFDTWDERVGHFRRYTPDQMQRLMRDAGLQPIQTTVYGWPLGYLTENVRNFLGKRRGSSGSGAAEESMADRTAVSGRLFQPQNLTGVAVRLGTAPFSWLQRLRPDLGTGLVGVGRKPAD